MLQSISPDNPMLAYLLLAFFFVASFVGAGIGAYVNDPVLMVLGSLPGLFGILGQMLYVSRK